MPVVEEALVARLTASTAVTALVGSSARFCYAVEMPNDVKLPALTYDLISAVRESEMTRDTGEVHARIQVTAWANTYALASGLSEAVRGATQRWAGTSTGVVVQEMFVENEFAFYDEETGSHAHTLDLMIHYEE